MNGTGKNRNALRPADNTTWQQSSRRRRNCCGSDIIGTLCGRFSIVAGIVGETYALPATLSRRSIASAITGAQERDEAWDSDPAALVVFMRDGAAAAEVTLRPFSGIKGGTLSDRDRETLETALRAWKDVDRDTLDVLVSNLLENGLNDRGWAFASYDAILDARVRQKKTKLENGKRY